MSNVTTEETWTAQGLVLNTYAFNISTVGGSRLAPRTLRGSDLDVPYRHGQVALPRYVGTHTLTLGMWVQGSQRDGSSPPLGSDQYKEFLRNFRRLRKALWSINEYDLTKKFYNDDLVLTEATAKVRFAGGLQPTMQGRAHGTFTVDLLLADPFFYGHERTEAVSVGTKNLVLDGDFLTHKIVIEFSGAATLYNDALGLSITTNEACTVEVQDGRVSGSAQVTHRGSPQLFALTNGENTLRLSGATATLKYREAYF